MTNRASVKTVLAQTFYEYTNAIRYGVTTVHADYADRQEPALDRLCLLALNNHYLVSQTTSNHDSETLRQCRMAITALSLSDQLKGADNDSQLGYVILGCKQILEDITKLEVAKAKADQRRMDRDLDKAHDRRSSHYVLMT